MKYFLTSGTNLELYFSCNDNLYEKGTLHFEAYNNPKMEGFPVIKEEIQGFDLRIAHDSVYGTNKIVTGCNYSGNTWWFAWVDIVPEAESENLTLDANDQPNEPLLNKTPKYSGQLNDYTDHGYTIDNQQMDVAAIAYGQDHQNGINITSDESSVRRVFFQLKNNVPGFPRFGVDKKKNMSGMWLYIRSLNPPGAERVFESFVKRNYFCEQDLFVFNNSKKGLKSFASIDLYETRAFYVNPSLGTYMSDYGSSTYMQRLPYDLGLYNAYSKQRASYGEDRKSLYDLYVSAPKYYPNGGPAWNG